MISQKLLILILLVIVPSLILAQDSCVSQGDCQPPDCFCASYKTYWTNLTTSQIPQFVLLTLDDSLVPAFDTLLTTLKKYKNNKNSNRTLPFTLYSMFDYTQFENMQKFYSWGHEIAVHTMNHNTNTATTWDTWLSQIKTAIDTFSNLANIPSSEFVGFRAPYLAYNSEMFEVLSQLGFLYDSSITEQIRTSGPSFNTSAFIWPYTFDNVNAQGAYDTGVPPSHQIARLFEVPMWILYSSGSAMQTMDAGATASQLMTLLNQRRSSNKAPLGIFNHIQSYGSTGEIESFITQCLTLDDVFFVTNRQLIEYMKNPVPYTQLSSQPYMKWTELTYPSSAPNSCSNYLFSTYNACPASTPTAPTYQTATITLNNMPVSNDSSLCSIFKTCNFANGGYLVDGQQCVLNNEIWEALYWNNQLPPGTGWVDLGSCISYNYGGSFSFDQPTYHVIKGDSATFQIIPDDGYAIDKVIVNSVNLGAISSYTFTNVQSSQTISVYFKAQVSNIQTYTITASGSYGCNVLQPTTIVNQGDNATFTFSPANNSCSLNSLLVDTTVIAASSSFTFTNVQSNHSILPICLCNYNLSVQNSNGCIISPSTQVVIQNSQQTFSISAVNSSCQVQYVTVDSSNLGIISTYTFQNVTASHTIGCSATCQPSSYSITVQNNGCTLNPTQSTTVLPGGSQSFSVSAPVGKQITGLNLNGQAQSISDPYSLQFAINNVNSNLVFAVTCSPLQFTATITNNGCVVSPSATQTVNYGDSLSYNINSLAGCTVNQIVVNDVAQNVASPYVIQNITSNQNLVAICTCPQMYTITASTSLCQMSPVGQITLVQGSSQSFAINTNAGCSISSINLDGSSISITNSSSMTVLVSNLQQNSVLTSTCTCPVTYTITSTTSGCTMNPLGTSTVTQGGSQSYSISASQNCTISSIILNNQSVSITNTTAMSVLVDNLQQNSQISSVCTCPVYYTVTSSTSGCTMTPLGTQTLLQGSNQIYSISSGSGCIISTLLLNGVSQTVPTNSQSMSFQISNLDSNKTLQSTCTCPTFTIAASTTACTMSPVGNTIVSYGGNQSYSISASTACNITSIQLNSQTQSITNSSAMQFLVSNVTANQTLKSTCTCPVMYTITSSGTNCAVSPLGAVQVPKGNNQSFTITANTGCKISTVKVNSTSKTVTNNTSMVYTFSNVSANSTLTSTCTCPTNYTVTSSTTNCTMSPLGASTVTSGGNLTFSISAPTGCSISSLLLNGASQTLTSTSSFSYTISNIKANQTLASSCSCSTSSNSSSSSICSNYTHWTATSYPQGTQVVYDGNGYSYVNSYWTNATQVPSQDIAWKLLNYCGQPAPCAELWFSGKAYNSGDVVMYNNNKYSAQYWTNQTIAPDATGSIFKLVGPC